MTATALRTVAGNAALERARAHRNLAVDGVRGGAPESYSVILYQGRLAQIEDCFLAPGAFSISRYQPTCQLVLPYLGICAFLESKGEPLIDANRSLFVAPGWSAFRASEKCATGYAALLVKPSRMLLDQIPRASCRWELSGWGARSAASTMRMRLLIQQLLRIADEVEPLQIDECIIQTFAEIIGCLTDQRTGCSKAVERAKELLHARSGERLHLHEIAIEVGVTPVYLTQEFTRCEGVPLYRYQLQLRLTRALLELPRCEDITGLALDLGFSSHSHFTSAFRKAFGTTPSRYRRKIGAPHPRLAGLAVGPASERGLTS